MQYSLTCVQRSAGVNTAEAWIYNGADSPDEIVVRQRFCQPAELLEACSAAGCASSCSSAPASQGVMVLMRTSLRCMCYMHACMAGTRTCGNTPLRSRCPGGFGR